MLLLLSFLSAPLFSQRFELEPPLFYEYYYSQIDSTQSSLQFVYRINYDKLSFIKEGENYTTKIRITIELQDSSTKNITRENEDKVITLAEFSETISKNSSIQGLLNLKADKKKYFATITLTDLLTNKDFSIPTIPIDLSSHRVQSFIVSQNEEGKYYLANKRKTIPFSASSYSLIFEADSFFGLYHSGRNDTLCMQLNSQTDTLSFCSTTIMDNSFYLEEDSIGIFLSQTQNSNTKSAYFQNISTKMSEGKYDVRIKGKSSSLLEVKWWDKPHSLLNYEISLKALSIIESASIVDSLRNLRGNNGYKYFNNYWRKYDPTPNTSYNELMAEFYSRADYAQKTFANFSTPDGILSDRGKIFIQYGQPSNIERTTSEKGRNMEIWFYKERNRSYYFIDKIGNGSYQMVRDK